MRTYKLYLIRHGLTRANLEGRYIGTTDLDLCEEGAAGLTALLREYEYPTVGRVYSSPLKRCVESARLLYPDLTPVVVDEIRECDLGEFENKTAYELADHPHYLQWIQNGPAYTPEGGEAGEAFVRRVVAGFDRIIQSMMRDRISDAAVITHAGVLSAFLAQCGLPRRELREWTMEPGQGYTLLVNASIWANAKLAEVFTPLPYGLDRDNIMLEYQKELFEE